MDNTTLLLIIAGLFVALALKFYGDIQYARGKIDGAAKVADAALDSLNRVKKLLKDIEKSDDK